MWRVLSHYAAPQLFVVIISFWCCFILWVFLVYKGARKLATGEWYSECILFNPPLYVKCGAAAALAEQVSALLGGKSINFTLFIKLFLCAELVTWNKRNLIRVVCYENLQMYRILNNGSQWKMAKLNFLIHTCYLKFIGRLYFWTSYWKVVSN